MYVFSLCYLLHTYIASINKQLQVKKSDDNLTVSTSKQAHPALEKGSAVELGIDSDVQYGVIKWIRHSKAYVEMVSHSYIRQYVYGYSITVKMIGNSYVYSFCIEVNSCMVYHSKNSTCQHV